MLTIKIATIMSKTIKEKGLIGLCEVQFLASA